MLALLASSPVLVSKTFTSSQSFTVPMGVSNLVSLSGKGQDGTPATPATRISNAQGDTVQGFASGTGTTSGALSWNDFQADITSVFNAVNAGGTGSGYVVNYSGYPNSNTYSTSLYQYAYLNAVPGTASVFTSTGWKTSGAIVPGDNGYFVINYTESYTIPATTGTDTSGFGKTFAGGVGGPAATSSFTDVPVTGGASYNLVVPSGGPITITYYQ